MLSCYHSGRNYTLAENYCCIFIYNLAKEDNFNFIEVTISELGSIKLFTKCTGVRNIILWYIYKFKGEKLNPKIHVH